MKYVFDAVTYRKYVLVRLQGVGASLNRETVSWKQCVFPVFRGQQSFWTLKAENHDLYKNGLLKLPRGSSITEVKSALLVRLFLSFSFSRVQASSFKLHSTHNIFYFVNNNTGLPWALYHKKKTFLIFIAKTHWNQLYSIKSIFWFVSVKIVSLTLLHLEMVFVQFAATHPGFFTSFY